MQHVNAPIRGFCAAVEPVNFGRLGTDGMVMQRGVQLLCLMLGVSGGCWAGAATAAQSDSIFVCIDADGHKTYQNSSEGSACHRVDGIIATIPSSELPRNQSPRPLPRAGISPASFPRVDTNTQRLRDSDRRHILEDELRIEEQRLASLRTEFNRDHLQRLYEDIERAEGNIASLRRELTPFRY